MGIVGTKISENRRVSCKLPLLNDSRNKDEVESQKQTTVQTQRFSSRFLLCFARFTADLSGNREGIGEKSQERRNSVIEERGEIVLPAQRKWKQIAMEEEIADSKSPRKPKHTDLVLE